MKCRVWSFLNVLSTVVAEIIDSLLVVIDFGPETTFGLGLTVKYDLLHFNWRVIYDIS